MKDFVVNYSVRNMRGTSNLCQSHSVVPRQPVTKQRLHTSKNKIH